MDPISNNPGMPQKSRPDKMKNLYKTAPHFGIPEGGAKRKELLSDRRKIAKRSILDARRGLEDPNNEMQKKKEKYKKKLLQWKINKEKQTKESANKQKPFLTGTVKVPLCYVPPPRLVKYKQKQEVVNKYGGGYKKNKPVSKSTNVIESNLARSIKNPASNSIRSTKPKIQAVSKASQQKSQAGPSYQSRLRTIPEEDDTVSKIETQLDTEVDRIVKMCTSWSEISKTMTLPGFAQELVLAATGQGKLLVTQKMEQCRALIEMSKKHTYMGTSGASHILSQDLQGFWDMVYLQVEDINKRFGELEQLKENNWEEEESKEKKKPSKKGSTKNALKFQKRPAPTSRFREVISEVKKKMMEKKKSGNEEAKGVEPEHLNASYITVHWDTETRKADSQLELPSTSGTAPAQYGSAPGTFSSTNTPSKGQEAVKERHCELELEENRLEQEDPDENKKKSEMDKTEETLKEEMKPSASGDIRQFIKKAKKTKSFSTKNEPEIEKTEFKAEELQNKPPMPSSNSSNTPLE